MKEKKLGLYVTTLVRESVLTILFSDLLFHSLDSKCYPYNLI